MYKTILYLYLCFLTFGIASAQTASLAERFTDEDTPITTPPLNTISTAGLGDELLHQGFYYERDVIHLSQKINIGENNAYTITPGYYVKTGGGGEWESYAPAANDPEGGSIKKAPDVLTLQAGFQVSSDGKKAGVVTNFYQAIYGEAGGITRTKRPALSTASIQQALVYGGKSGNKIKMGYREIWMYITRPSELQFVEYDLSKSKIVKSHGARIEVLEATSTSIKYRITKSFNPAD